MPAGYVENGPVGISIMGHHGTDERLLQLAVTLSELLGFKYLNKD